MSKMKVYELAKEINKQSKDIISFLNDKGVDIKSHMSNIELANVDMVKSHFSGNKPTKPSSNPDNKIVEPKKPTTGINPGNSNTQNRTDNNTNNIRPGTSSTNTSNRPSGNAGNTNTNNRPSSNTGNTNTNNRPSGNTGNTNNRPTGNTGSTYNRPSGNTGNTNNRPSGNTGNTNNRTAGNTGNTYNRPSGNTGNTNNRTAGNTGNTYNRPSGNTGNTNNRTAGNTGNTYNRPSGNTGNTNNRPSSNTGNTYNRPSSNTGNTYNRPSGNTGNTNNRPATNTGTTNNRPGANTGNTNNRPGSNNTNGRKPYSNRPNQGNRAYGNQRKNYDNNAKPKDPNRKGAFIMPKLQVQTEEIDDGIKTIIIPEVLTIKELTDKMKVPASVVVKKLFLAGTMVSINSEITFETAEEIAIEYDYIVELEEKVDLIEELLKEEEEDQATLKKRPPVVCVMGHVDHGKTSLLDAIRQSHVTNHEAGGITQHIGAYVVNVGDEKITFLDTPGHEAFTSMRMRGAQSTDIAILVVAADDGVMPQTVEAINHARAAGIEIIVAINKIDKPSANIERVKQELVEHELIAEDWGGSTIFVPVSAHTKDGISQLLEMISLTAEILELKANPDRNARGLVVEAQLDKGRGPVATILVQKGTLNIGDSIVIGSSYGKVRAMMDDKGVRVKEATPSTPVEILGLNEVPDAGETFMAVDNEKEARSIAETYISQGREKLLSDTKAKLSLDGLFSQIQAGNIKELNLVVKADVQGSVEAVKQSLVKLSNDEVAIRIIHGGVGAINESDVILASASNAIIIGFNVRPDNTAKGIAEQEKVDLRLYRVIYNAIEDIEAAMKGLLDPIYEEKVIGHAEVRQVFKASGLGNIAGSYVLDGKVTRNSSVRIIRDSAVIYDGPLASLKRFKDDVKEVAAGYECGFVFEKHNDVKEGDTIEIYIMQEVPR